MVLGWVSHVHHQFQITFGSRPVVGLSLGIGFWCGIARVTFNIVGTNVNFHDTITLHLSREEMLDIDCFISEHAAHDFLAVWYLCIVMRTICLQVQ
jgi:hypothetical protein